MGSQKQLNPTHPAANPSVNTASNGGSLNPDQSTQSNRSTLNKQTGRPVWTTKTWPHDRKAAAVTEVARESISVAGNITSEVISSTVSLPQTRSSNRPSSIQLIKKASASNRSLPADVTTTRINIDSNSSSSNPSPNEDPLQSTEPSDNSKKHEDNNTLIAEEDSKPAKENSDAQDLKDIDDTVTTTKPEAKPELNEQSEASWLGWLGLSWAAADKPGPGELDMGNSPDRPELTPASTEDAQSSKIGGKVREINEDLENTTSQNDSQQKQKETNNSVPQKRSWIQTWGTTSANKVEENQQESPVKEPRLEQGRDVDQTVSVDESINQTSQADKAQDSDLQKRISGSGRQTGWAFWSRDAASPEQKQDSETQQETGELVIASEQPKVQSKSEETVAQVESIRSSASTPTKPQQRISKKSTKSVDIKNVQSIDVVEESTLTAHASTVQSPVLVQTPAVTASTKLESVLTNQLIPSFRDTFALQESPSWLKSLGRMIYSSKSSGNKHVLALRDPPRPKKAIAIGVHGYFPAPYLRTVLGQPTGTSLKFSTMAAMAIHKWAEKHGYHCDVEKIALEGEGRIAERVDLLWNLLLKWIEEIRKADFVMFACHSQGVPVTVMLVAKLIAFGCLDATRVGVCAMAGVSLGPFPDYKSRFIGGSAGELFDFALPTTKVSRDYESALKTALDFGVRISYVGSLDDQLVSLESSLFVPVSHPYIYRAVFVDGKVHAPGFLSHLVGFALKLRNLGIYDHGLIRELSTPLVGNLVGGGGHSRLHDEENIYYLAVEFALETSNVSGASLHIQHHLTSTPNPYILPFALRGLLEEDYVRHELHDESFELLKQFDEWKPATKVLRDVKFRLEGIRSKL